MVSRPCLGNPGKPCGAIVPASARRCAECSTAYNRERGSSHKRGYTRGHRMLSREYRRVNPLCELRYPGCTFLAIDADHKVPRRAGGRNEWANYQSVCRPCHARKTREDAERYPA